MKVLSLLTLFGDLVFSGIGRRITGDFSNATIANRLMFQTNSANNYTVLRAIPNGTGNYAEIGVGNNSDQGAATSTAFLSISSTEVRLSSSQANGGNLLPLAIHIGGERLRIDPTTGNVLATSGALGYGVGAGGAVVQATSKSTAVTLNKPSGQITMNNGALGANTTVAFSLNNTFINGESDLLIKVKGGSVDNAAYQVWAFGAAVGSIAIAVRNISNVTLSESIVLEFKVVQGVNS